MNRDATNTLWKICNIKWSVIKYLEYLVSGRIDTSVIWRTVVVADLHYWENIILILDRNEYEGILRFVNSMNIEKKPIKNSGKNWMDWKS